MDGSRHTTFSRRLGQMSDDARRSWRRSIYQETRKCIDNRGYRKRSGELVRLDLPEIAFSQMVSRGAEVTGWDRPRVGNTRVVVYEGDCFEAGIALRSRGLNPVILNMASAKNPGGGVTNGAGAQEENLFRRSTYSYFLYNSEFAHYPIPPTGAIYTPNVSVFRHPEASEYAWMDSPVQLACIALPALVKPQLCEVSGRGTWLSPANYDLSKEKIATFMKLTLSNNHDSVVFSAWGCGAYRNPPRCIATAMKEVLESQSFEGRLREVVFAIFDDHNANKAHNPEGNVLPFAEVFGVQPVTSLS